MFCSVNFLHMPALCPSIRYINLCKHLSKLQAVNHSSKRKQSTGSKQKLNIHVGETSMFAYKYRVDSTSSQLRDKFFSAKFQIVLCNMRIWHFANVMVKVNHFGEKITASKEESNMQETSLSNCTFNFLLHTSFHNGQYLFMISNLLLRPEML